MAMTKTDALLSKVSLLDFLTALNDPKKVADYLSAKNDADVTMSTAEAAWRAADDLKAKADEAMRDAQELSDTVSARVAVVCAREKDIAEREKSLENTIALASTRQADATNADKEARASIDAAKRRIADAQKKEAEVAARETVALRIEAALNAREAEITSREAEFDQIIERRIRRVKNA